MTRRTTLLAGAGALVFVFLVGFVPQYGKVRALRNEAVVGQEHILALQEKLKLAELRDLMGLIYLETNQKNYGVARQHSTQFFTMAGELTAAKLDPSVTAVLQETLLQRDALTAGLAEGQPAILKDIEEALNRLYQSTRHY